MRFHLAMKFWFDSRRAVAKSGTPPFAVQLQKSPFQRDVAVPDEPDCYVMLLRTVIDGSDNKRLKRA